MNAPDLDRLAREVAVRKRLQEALLLFSRAMSAKLSLSTALNTMAGEVTASFGTHRTSIWLFDRAANQLTLTASSDPHDSAATPGMRADEDSPLTRALRADGPELSGSGEALLLVAPLRGWRRALGTLAIEGPPTAVSPQQFVELSGELARQLSVTVENLLVLEEVIRRYGDYEQARTQLAHARKVGSLGQFVATIAHEMNNPLQGVLGHAELVMQTLTPGSPQRASLERIYKDAERASKMVQDLLLFTGSQRMSKREVDMARLIADTIAIRESTPYRAQIEFVQEGPSTLPPVFGDAGLLQQVLLNIILNAEQAIANSTGSGRVTVTGCAGAADLTIRIDDTGPGIPADLLPRIFEPFFTTKDAGKGTGLGLAITVGIIHEHGGTIAAGVSPHGGARFTIQLPVAQ